MSGWPTIALCTIIPVATMIAGGVLAAFRPPGPKLRSGIQHFAAGVVFAVVAAELLPDVKKEHAPIEMALSFGLGVSLMLGLRAVVKRLERRTVEGLPWGLIAGVALDVLIDGLLLGVGFAAGERAGRLLATALAVELLSLGLATAASAVEATRGRRGATIALTAALAAVFAVGGVTGASALRGLPAEGLAMVLSFGCAALLYLVTEELLVEAHEVPETPLITAMFFAGFLLLFVLDVVQSGR